MIVVTDGQIADRDSWERRLQLGECSLYDALFMCMASGAPITPYLLARYEAAIHAYQYGQVTDLAEPFGMAITQRQRKAEARWTWVSNVKFHVDAYHDQGFSKQDPNHYENTAFEKAATLLGRRASSLFDDYYGKKKRVGVKKKKAP